MVRTGLGRLLKRLVMNRQGSITPVFAAMIVPLTMVGGFSVDLARAHEGRAKLQDAVDAAALALAHQPAGTPLTTLTAQAQTWINGDLHDTDLAKPVNVNITQSNGQLILVANTTESALVSGLVGLTTMAVTANSTVKWGLAHVEVALVLDNTGSMAGTKIQTLTSAAQTLVTTLMSQAGSDPTAVKISVVPFGMTVNVGSSYKTATWMRGDMPTQYGTDEFNGVTGVNRFTLLSAMKGQTWGGCVEARPAPYDTQDTPPDPNTPATMFIPFFAPDEPDTGSNFSNNYIGDNVSGNPTWQARQGGTTKYSGATSKTGTSSSGYAYGPNAGCEIKAPLLRLTNDTTAINTALSNMTAVGDTNLVVGLQWGWLTLSPNAPFADGVAYNTANTTKIIVFLTDGWNQNTDSGNSNASYYSSEGYLWQGRLGVTTQAGNPNSAMDTRTAKICSNIKAQNIVIYTVRIDVSSAQSPAVLQTCATSTSQFYDVPQVANLPTAFNAIAGEIGKLRLAQ
jgi:Flp pilus assembly protein TadG